MVKIQSRRDTAVNWASTNPILAAGERGYDTTYGSFRVGNGTDHWQDLPEFNPVRGSIITTVTAATYTIANDLNVTVLADASSNNIAITLPIPDEAILVRVKKEDSTNHTVTISGSGLIDRETNYILEFEGEFVALESDGTNWQVVGE